MHRWDRAERQKPDKCRMGKMERSQQYDLRQENATESYTAVVRPVQLYGAEAWPLRKSEKKQLERTEMRMLRGLMGVFLRTRRRRNEDIRTETGVVSITEKAREASWRWYGHVTRMQERDPAKMAWRSRVEGRRDGIERDERQLNLEEEDEDDRKY